MLSSELQAFTLSHFFEGNGCLSHEWALERRNWGSGWFILTILQHVCRCCSNYLRQAIPVSSSARVTLWSGVSIPILRLPQRMNMSSAISHHSITSIPYKSKCGILARNVL
ncbi:hypothetical protein KC19_1G075700 [Ceratodon purpureus]|uniref:Uncharacterized protein n=1 Tax=Ceratodon purpureus TaxID=3225 RepID=A0A8T0J5S4_CERPU|nr:hypothetical protein KC19_1G075700 [Ceratodon purpureus]